MDVTASERLFARARRLIPGGVNSPVRAFGSVGGTPPFLASGRGATVWDEDGNAYLDAVGSWGPMILGHAHPAVIEAVREAALDGTSFGAPTRREVELAEVVLDRHPGLDRIRFVNSGTEATMSALRVARGATGRDRIVKFAGNYHGHADGLLVAAGSGAMTTGVPSSAGVPDAIAGLTTVARYNDVGGLRELFAREGDDIAAVIFEPVVGNSGVIEPTPEFLDALRSLTREHGALLVADEVMTGFRLARGGATERYDLEPDLICWGKIVGGGLPVGAYGGPAEIMDHVSPVGRVYQAGTLSGNPLAMAAGLATFRAMDEAEDLYDVLEARGARLQEGLEEGARAAGIPLVVNRVGSMLTPFFCDGPVQDDVDAQRTDAKTFARWFHGLLGRGVYWPASAFEAAFLSYALSEADVERMIEAAAEAFQEASA
jgi:glutamate-1-semialdehyde 2,1-aminomutase